jgi:Flp pilus assembly protein TadB
MHKDSDQRLEELAQQKLDGKSYSDIRKDLAKSGMKEEEISRLIRQVDERVLKETLDQGKRQQTKQWHLRGLILAVAGLLLTILYKAGLVFTQVPALLVYTPFLFGVLLMFYGRMLQRRALDQSSKGPSPIRKKRPYK